MNYEQPYAYIMTENTITVEILKRLLPESILTMVKLVSGCDPDVFDEQMQETMVNQGASASSRIRQDAGATRDRLEAYPTSTQNTILFANVEKRY